MGSRSQAKLGSFLSYKHLMPYIIMFNYSQERLPNKLLMEINRNEEVPKLVRVHEISRSKDARNKLLMQARIQTQSNKTQLSPIAGIQRKIHFRLEGTRNQQENLILQHSENDQLRKLRQVVKQLTAELEKLRSVNEGLITRIKEVQNSYRFLSSDFEKTHQQGQRKLKISIYRDVQEYVKVVVQRLTLTLKQERMTPSLQLKLQRFFAQMMQINSVTVEQFVKLSRFEFIGQEEHLFRQSRATVTNKYKNVTDKKSIKDEMPANENYTHIMKRLTAEPRMSKSYAAPGLSYVTSKSQDIKFRNVYTTTPQKRKRIFQ